MFESKWHAIVPVKGIHDSKTRLGRHDLTIPLLTDVVIALLGSTSISAIKIVTTDPVIAELAASLHCEIIPEEEGVGLSSAIKDGLSRCNSEGQSNVLVLLGDLPCLTSAHIDLFLDAGSAHETAFLADAEGTGTTMWMRTSLQATPPQFGIRSRAKHRESGAHEVLGESFAGARRDVDTEVNLWDAVRIGVGTATKTALANADLPTTENENSQMILTISRINPLEGIDEVGKSHLIEDHSAPDLISPRVGQRVVAHQKIIHNKS
jgi:2-phospho-L-lactate guanylyltransferase